jgi:hypothetical protein
MSPLLACVAFVLGPGAQEPLKGKDPAQSLAAAAEAMGKVKGLTANLSVRGSVTDTISGQVSMKEQIARLKGKLEVWCRDHRYVVKTVSEGYVRDAELDEQQRAAAAPAVNPLMILREALAAGSAAEGGPDERVGDADCRVVSAAASEGVKKAQVPMMFQKLRGTVESSLSARLDPAASVSTYRIWIGKKDARVRKIVWEVAPRISEAGVVGIKALAGAVNKLSATYTVTYSGFDTEVKLPVPPEVAAQLKP